MARTKKATEFQIGVEGEVYLWRLQRRPQWSSDPAERRGMALSVRHTQGQREAILEFPVGSQPRFGLRQLQPSQIAVELVVKGISSALAAGWEPLSRGRAVSIVVDETGG